MVEDEQNMSGFNAEYRDYSCSVAQFGPVCPGSVCPCLGVCPDFRWPGSSSCLSPG